MKFDIRQIYINTLNTINSKPYICKDIKMVPNNNTVGLIAMRSEKMSLLLGSRDIATDGTFEVISICTN